MNQVTELVQVSEYLKGLVIKNGIMKEGHVFFNSPSEIPVTRPKPWLLIYLYHVGENMFLRNEPPPDPYVSPGGRVDGRVTIEKTPLPLDLHYLFVPYAEDPVMELIILGGLKKLFYDVNEVEPPVSRKGDYNMGYPVNIVRNDLTVQEIHDLWSVFPQKEYKTSLVYIATPVMIRSSLTEEYSRVVEIGSTYYS